MTSTSSVVSILISSVFTSNKSSADISLILVKSKRQNRADAIQKHQQQLQQILASVVADAIKAVGLEAYFSSLYRSS
jgi:hypothetical protein